VKIAFVYLNGETSVGRGAGYISSVIVDIGHDLTFFDTVYEPLDIVSKKITSGNFDIVLISASTLFYKDAVSIATLIKQSSTLPILLGGAHSTIVRGEILKDCPYIEYICVGEGEDFIREFLNKFGTNDLFLISNLGYRDIDGTIKINPIRDCTDLTTLPDFKYELFSPRSVIINAPLPGFCYVFSTRGCPYACSYCCNSYYLTMYKKGFLRKRNVDSVIKELLYLKDAYPVKIFYFGDEMILFDKDYVTELFTRVRDEVGLPYGCMARVENVNTEIVNLFNETGCKYVGMGIECGDETFRKEFLNRHMSNSQIIQAFRMLRNVTGVKLTSYNMHGYPVPYDDRLLEATRALNERAKPDIIQMSLFFPFPGTKLYDYCVENNLIDYDKLNGVTDYFKQSVLKPF
jgi:radical SAM superfamily enzyme YgiQ (UPF0313 family)